MKVLRAAVVLGVSTPLVVLACGSDDGTVRQPAAGGQGGESAGESGASGSGTSGSPVGGEPSRGGVPSVEGGGPNGGAPDTAGQPSGGAGGVPSEPEPACGDAAVEGGLVCFGAPQVVSLIEGTPTDLAIGAWDAEDGPDVIVAASVGLMYFSNTAGVFADESYVGTGGAILGAGQLDLGGELDLLLAPPSSVTSSIVFGDGAGQASSTQQSPFGAEGELYNYFVADLAGSPASHDIVVTFNNRISVVATSGTEGEGFEGFVQAANPANPQDGVLAKLGSAQWLVYSANASIYRQLATYDLGSVALGAPLQTAAGITPAQLDVGDFNEDGFEDVVATSADAGDLSVLFADGADTGDFAVVEGTDRFLMLSIGASDEAKTQKDVKVGDFNGDGHADIAVSVQALDAVAVFSGDGEGAFGPAQLVSTGADSGPARIAVGDLNDDGVDDLAVVGEESGKIILLLSDP